MLTASLGQVRGSWATPAAFFAGMLFSLLKSASGNLQIFQIPSEIAELVQAIIIYLVAIQYAIILVLDKIDFKGFKKKREPKSIEGGDA